MRGRAASRRCSQRGASALDAPPSAAARARGKAAARRRTPSRARPRSRSGSTAPPARRARRRPRRERGRDHLRVALPEPAHSRVVLDVDPRLEQRRLAELRRAENSGRHTAMSHRAPSAFSTSSADRPPVVSAPITRIGCRGTSRRSTVASEAAATASQPRAQPAPRPSHRGRTRRPSRRRIGPSLRRAHGPVSGSCARSRPG